MPHRPRLLVLTASALLTLGLAGCGDTVDTGDTAGEPPSSTTPVNTPSASSPAAPTTTPAAPPTDAVTDAVTVDVTDLPTGPPPRVDVVVDRTLFHDGREIELPADLAGAYPLGTFEGRTYLSQGAQVVTVADDGTATEVGTPHETYNRLPGLVPETGHVLFIAQNRNGPSVVTVMDAVTGEVVAVARGAYRSRPAEYDALEPADRALAEGWESGGGMDDVDVTARSADGTIEVVLTESLEAGPPVTLSLQSAVDGDGATAFAFPYPDPDAATYDVVLRDQVVLESDEAFLMIAGTGTTPDGFESVVVRCTAAGTCERVTPVGGRVQVAGTDLPLPARAS